MLLFVYMDFMGVSPPFSSLMRGVWTFKRKDFSVNGIGNIYLHLSVRCTFHRCAIQFTLPLWIVHMSLCRCVSRNIKQETTFKIDAKYDLVTNTTAVAAAAAAATNSLDRLASSFNSFWIFFFFSFVISDKGAQCALHALNHRLKIVTGWLNREWYRYVGGSVTKWKIKN